VKEPTRTEWSIQIIALDSVGMRSYELRRFTASESEAMDAISLLTKLPRPIALGSEEARYWLRAGDLLVAVPIVGKSS